MVYDGVDESRTYHASEGRDYRKYRLFRRGELSVGYLALDFQSYREEENHHQDVVYELLDVHSARKAYIYGAVRTGAFDGELGVQYIMVQVAGEREIGQKQGHGYANQKKRALKPRLVG